MQQFTDTEGFFETSGIFFSHFSQIKPTKRWSIQKLCFSLLRIDGPLVSRFVKEMRDNVFLENKKELELADFMNYTDGSRGNLGKDIPVTIYRLLEYSIREQLIRQFGKETQIQVFQDAGFRAGAFFCRKYAESETSSQFICRRASAMVWWNMTAGRKELIGGDLKKCG